MTDAELRRIELLGLCLNAHHDHRPSRAEGLLLLTRIATLEAALSVERLAEALTEAGLTTTLDVGRNWAGPLHDALVGDD